MLVIQIAGGIIVAVLILGAIAAVLLGLAMFAERQKELAEKEMVENVFEEPKPKTRRQVADEPRYQKTKRIRTEAAKKHPENWKKKDRDTLNIYRSL